MDNLGPLFVQPHEPERFWILVVLVTLPVIVAASIVLVRGRLPHVLSSYVLLLVPAFAYILGDIHMMEQSQQVEFCGSCHTTMSPIVAAMQTNGDTLAGFHYQRGAVPHANACYTCHSGYGIWGGYRAKRAGVRHMLHTVTENFEFPLELDGQFDINSCLNCHAGAKPFRNAEPHKDPELQRMLLSHEMMCTDCHPAAHPPEALNGVAAASQGKPPATEGGAR